MTATPASAHSVRVAWQPATVPGGSVSGYVVERMTKQAVPSALGSLYGHAEVQKVMTYTSVDVPNRWTNATGGTFTLAFGDVDEPLPGTVAATQGRQYLRTSVDLTPHLGRRDAIKVCAAADACQTLTVAENRVFNSTHLYVDQVYTGATAIGATLYHRDTTIPLAWDASAADVEGALDALASLGDVRVSRVFDDDSSADPANANPANGLHGAAATDPAPNAGRVNGYVWAVTFLTDVGDLPPLVANAFGLRLSSAMDDNRGASAPYLQVVEQYKGVVPHNHTNVTVAGDATEVTMPSLTTGAEYGFRVTALTDQGAGAASRVAAVSYTHLTLPTICSV